ncbi:MAG: methyltransferase type 12, partial [Candidatus Dadabacteria bacterium]|nr:methyltransferase type 12 [Candidatus Dadabacteria bacterium]
ANSGYYDTILYIDVLEHIEDDYNELQSAKKLLSDTGTLIILSPAHQWLFSEFDEAIGHHRRYTKATLLKIIPDELNLINIRYLDSIGLFASLANRVLMRKSIPSMNQIKFWDRVMVP